MVIHPAALEKRIKRHVRSQQQRFYVIVPPGFEATACRELAEWGDFRRAGGSGRSCV